MAKLDKSSIEGESVTFWLTMKKLSSKNLKQLDCEYEKVLTQMKEMSYIPPEPYFDLDFKKHCNDFLNDYTDEDNLLLKSPTLEMFNSNGSNGGMWHASP